jgi:CBS domain-containing protein
LRNSIMTEKLARRGLRVHQDYEADVLRSVNVGDVMATNVPTIKADMPVTELANLIAKGDPVLTRHQAVPIVDEKGHLAGIITRGDVLRAIETGKDGAMTVLQAGNTDLVVAYPDEPVYDAVERMLRHGIGRVPVVDRKDPQELVGYLGRSGVLEARMRRIQEENVREPGWLLHRNTRGA